MNMHFASVSDTAFKAAMTNLAAAVSVVTTLSEGEPMGLTASSVTSFSAQPPCVAVNIDLASGTGRSLQPGNPLCVNLLAGHQAELAAIFAGRTQAIGKERFASADWRVMRSGAPALKGALANIDGFIEEVIVRHTHALVLARVVAIATIGQDTPPLLYWQRQFGTFAA